MNKIKELLTKYNVKPKKHLGQNFLVNEAILEKIAWLGDISRDDVLLEIGPGTGSLTKFLVKDASQVIAIEKDPEMVKILESELEEQENLKIINQDILKFEPGKFITDNYKIFGNIPYYITSHLLKVILEEWPKPKIIVLLVQKEVAQRITAEAKKTKEKPGLLSVSVQLLAQVKIDSYVSKNYFWPVPDVDSAVLILKPHQQFDYDPLQTIKIAKAGFKQKRKKLISNLIAGLKIAQSELEKVFKNLGLNLNARAEELKIENWISLEKIIEKNPV